MRRSFRTLTVLLFLFILPSAALAISQGDEIEIGRQALADLRQIGYVHEPALTEVGNALKTQVERKDLPWDFWVLEEPKELNAFALPGGFVFITRRYYEMLSPDELAFVVGHEMAHIEEKHFEEKLSRAKQAQLYDILAGLILGAADVSRGWRTVASAGVTAHFTKYSRKLEREADLVGYNLAQQAGFDTQAAITALSKLGDDKKDPIFGTIFSTHPLLSSREDRLAAMEAAGPPAQPRPNITKEANPNWKPIELEKDELYSRPGVAVRVIGESGEPWDNPRKEALRMILSQEIEYAGKFDVKAEDEADSRKMPRLESLRDKNAVILLVVTVHQMDSEVLWSKPNHGAEIKARLALSAEVIDTRTGAVTPLEDIKITRQDIQMLPTSETTLYPDMVITQAVQQAAESLAQRISQTAPSAVEVRGISSSVVH